MQGYDTMIKVIIKINGKLLFYFYDYGKVRISAILKKEKEKRKHFA